MGNCAVTAPVYETESRSYENQPLLLPQKSPTSNVVTQYLFGRGIDYEIINECLDKELIIESLPYHNVVFIGYDDKKEAKYAAYRATNNSRIKRTIKKQFWLSRSEAQDLQKKAKKACLSEAGLIRLLLKGYEPREKPDADFYEAMKELSAIGNNINQLAVKANSLGFVDAPQLKKEAERWHKFQADMERIYLRPDKSELKWQ
ncbi:plasmid mobilization protein [[Ruminococcus] lactaris]|uniref:plasmid mobilization protein n=1 Tax=[Ruminococcus] lactaris TaxID=46228 RepID=UPI003079734C